MSYTLSALRASGIAQFTANSASTSTTSGSIRVTGGVGVNGDIYCLSSNVIDTSLTDAYVRVGHDIAGNFNSGYLKFNYAGDDDLTNNVELGFTTTGGVDSSLFRVGRTGCNVLQTTDSSSKTTGALTISGGVGVLNNLYVGGNLNVDSLTASQSVQTDSSKNLVTIANTGTGSNVLSNSPSLVTPSLGAATATSLIINSLSASQVVFTDGSKNLVSVATNGTGNVVRTTSAALVTPDIGTATGTSLTLISLTANTILQCDGSKVITSASTTGTGNVVRENTPTLITPVLGVATGTSLALSSSTDATSTSTGALTAVGGISSQKNIFSAGYTAINTTAAPRINLKYDGGNFNGSFLKYNYVGNDNSANTFSVGFTTPGSDQTAMTFGRDQHVIPYTTASTSSTTGALRINGGLGVAGDINSAGTLAGAFLNTGQASVKLYQGVLGSGSGPAPLALDVSIYSLNSLVTPGPFNYVDYSYFSRIGDMVTLTVQLTFDKPAGTPLLSVMAIGNIPYKIRDSHYVQVPCSTKSNFAGVTNPFYAELSGNATTYTSGFGTELQVNGKQIVLTDGRVYITPQSGAVTGQRVNFTMTYWTSDPY